MPFPEPEPGLVISYAYLWRHEHHKGQTEGRKARPCVIILSVKETEGEQVVTVVPVTHTPPSDKTLAVEIPLKVKHCLKLDDRRSWIRVDEVNQFAWPGYDLRPTPGNKSRYHFGFIPPSLFERVKLGVLDLYSEKRLKRTNRD